MYLYVKQDVCIGLDVERNVLKNSSVKVQKAFFHFMGLIFKHFLLNHLDDCGIKKMAIQCYWLTSCGVSWTAWWCYNLGDNTFN